MLSVARKFVAINTMQELRRITGSDDVFFEAAMEIYLHSFPANERQSVETIRTRLDHGQYILFTTIENSDVLGLLLLYPLVDCDFMVIDYLAINNEHRKKGIGAWLLLEVMDMVRKEYKDKYIVLETEDPEYGENRGERAARVGFYKKLGARKLEGVHYILPALAGDMPTEMILMLMPGYENDVLPGQWLNT